METQIGDRFSTCPCHERPYDEETGYHPGRFNGTFVTQVLPFLATILGLLILTRSIFPSVFAQVPDYILPAPFGVYLFLYGLGMKRGYIGFFNKPTSRIREDKFWMTAGIVAIVMALLLFLF